VSNHRPAGKIASRDPDHTSSTGVAGAGRLNRYRTCRSDREFCVTLKRLMPRTFSVSRTRLDLFSVDILTLGDYAVP